MFKLLLLLMIRLDPLTAPNYSDETSSKGEQKSILPLVLIRTKENEFIHPTTLPFTKTDNDGNFLFGTTFQAEKDGRQLFFCGQSPIGERFNSGNRYCSYELPALEGSNYNLQCAYEPEPYVLELSVKKDSNEKEKKEIKCESLFNQNGVMLAFVYEVKTLDDDETHIFEMYRFCYNRKYNKILFTEHAIAAPHFLDPANDLFERERIQKYKMSDEPYGFFGTKYETIKNAYKTFQELEDQKEVPPKKRSRETYEKSSITNKFQLSDQKLVPSDDMAFALWRKTTYHFLNVGPMNEEKIKLWDHINQLIRKDAINKSKEYHIYTGAFDLVSEGKDETELIQPPDVWVKVVHYTSQNDNERHNESIAIVMNHNPHIAFIDRSIGVICEKNLCKNAFIKKFPTVGKSVCCAPSGKVDFYFGIEVKDHKLLKIDSFFDEEESHQ